MTVIFQENTGKPRQSMIHACKYFFIDAFIFIAREVSCSLEGGGGGRGLEEGDSEDERQ